MLHFRASAKLQSGFRVTHHTIYPYSCLQAVIPIRPTTTFIAFQFYLFIYFSTPASHFPLLYLD